VIASKIALSLSRYVRDVSLFFNHSAQSISNDVSDEAAIREHLRLLAQMNVERLTLLSPSNDVEGTYSLQGGTATLPDEQVIELLRIGSKNGLHKVQISDQIKLDGRRYFILGFNLPDGGFAIGYLSLDYIKSVQEKIAFGKLGHSAIFDATGRAVAHPIPRVEENMMDGSGIPTVRKMLDRQTGVDIFYSPPMKADMIAGFTFVPETGWAVMVPQPLSELMASVSTSLRQTHIYTIAASLTLALFGWIMARSLVRPIRRFTDSSLEIARGNYAVILPERESSSVEMWQLNEALKTMIDRVRNSNTRLRQALEIEAAESKRKDEFLIIASHELRNPMSGVIGMIDVCREKASDEDLKHYLGVASRSAAHLNRIVGEMVDFAEEHTNSAPIRADSVDLGQEFDDIASIYQKIAEQAGLAFRYVPKGLRPRLVKTDRHRLVQVMGNLLGNAIKYTTEGTVTLSVSLTPNESGDTGLLDISVRDTGIGMSEDQQKRIFEPFFQADRSYSRLHSGLGIGLSVVQSIVGRLNGKISVRSEQGKGTDFRLRIPVKMDRVE
jgi:signal transduction histidine kinase